MVKSPPSGSCKPLQATIKKMTTEEFLTFQKFNDKEALLELETLFNDNNIEYLIEDASANFDPSFANSELSKEFRIKLKKQDFEKADNL